MPANLVRKRFYGKALSVNREDMSLTVVMSNRAKDRDGDVVEPKGAQLTNWKENPVVLWAHDRKAPPIAKVLETLVSDDMVMGTVQFDRKDPFSVLIFNKYADGFLNAWSIGFRADQKGMEPMTNEEGVVTGFHFKEWELLELSAVPVPANPGALVREVGGMEKELQGRFLTGGMLMAKEGKNADLEKLFKEIEEAQANEEVLKPYPNEHAARLRDPGLYKRFRRENDKFGSGIHAIWGIRKDNDAVELQAIRFDKTKFTPAEAKAWLKEHEHKPILFEPASDKTEKRHAILWDDSGVKMLVEGEEDMEPCAKKLRAGAFAKSVDERGKSGKIPVIIELGEASVCRVDFTVVNEADGEIAEAKVLSARFTLSLLGKTAAPTPPEPGRTAGTNQDNSVPPTPPGAGQESPVTLEALELEIMRLRAKASCL